MSCQPVFIDGPLKGKQMVVDHFPIQIAESVPPVPSYFNPLFDPLVDIPYNVTTYYLHRVAFGKRIIAVSSTNPVPPSEDQLFRLLFTRRAQSAVVT